MLNYAWNMYDAGSFYACSAGMPAVFLEGVARRGPSFKKNFELDEGKDYAQ